MARRQTKPTESHDVNVDMPPVLARFMTAPNKIRGVMGPVGSGKSSACVLEIGLKAAAMPLGKKSKKRQSRWVVVRNTFRRLSDTTKKTWLYWFPENYLGQFHQGDMTHHIQVGDMDLEVLFRAIDSPDTIDQFKSMDLTGFWLNEASEIPIEALEILETRTGRYPPQSEVEGFWHGGLMDTNPPDDSSWWHHYAEELSPVLLRLGQKTYGSYFDALQQIPRAFSGSQGRKERAGLQGAINAIMLTCKTEEEAKVAFTEFVNKYVFFNQPGGLTAEAENIGNLPGGYAYYRNMVVGKSQEWINVFVHGKYGTVTTGKPVFTSYSDDLHYSVDIDEPIEGIPILVGWDLGRASAVCLSQVDYDGYWRVFDEVPETDLTIDQFGSFIQKYLKTEYPGYKFVHIIDPSGFHKNQYSDRTSADILMAKGFNLEGGEQNLNIRLNCMTWALTQMIDGSPEFQIGRKCQMLRKGFNGAYAYRRMHTTGERFSDDPDKNHPCSHVMDSLQYVATYLYKDLILTDRSSEYDHDDDYPDEVNAGRSAITGY